MTKLEMLDKVSTSKKAVAFTFDDGPNPIYTPQILTIFKEAEGKATFFMIGEQMERYPEIVKKVAEQGHEIGNHTYTHPRLSQVTPVQCLEEIERSEELTRDLVGINPVVFRPPYLDYNDETVSIVKEKGYLMIGALNLEAQYWEQPGVEHILEASRGSAGNGSILIFHDGYGDRSQTIAAVRVLVSELKAQGYQLVTLSELLNK